MSSLHESCSGHLQTLSHAVHPSVAQKDKNLTAPDQDYRWDGGAQSNPIWQLLPGFADILNEQVSWIPVKPQSPVTLFQFLEGFDVRVRIDCLISGHHIHQNHSIRVPKDGDRDISGRRSCLELLFSW